MIEPTTLTLGEFRRMTQHLEDETRLCYHSYYKGCGLSCFTPEDVWLYPTKDGVPKCVVINPASNYDSRASRKHENP